LNGAVHFGLVLQFFSDVLVTIETKFVLGADEQLGMFPGMRKMTGGAVPATDRSVKERELVGKRIMADFAGRRFRCFQQEAGPLAGMGVVTIHALTTTDGCVHHGGIVLILVMTFIAEFVALGGEFELVRFARLRFVASVTTVVANGAMNGLPLKKGAVALRGGTTPLVLRRDLVERQARRDDNQ
jgi:hypothetical protein